jgi:hypothetical protein
MNRDDTPRGVHLVKGNLECTTGPATEISAVDRMLGVPELRSPEPGTDPLYDAIVAKFLAIEPE